MTRHFEFSEGSSNKFWEVDVVGNAVTTRWGRLGTPGQQKTKPFASPAAAQKEHDALVREKTRKGYLESTKANGAKATVSQPVARAHQQDTVFDPKTLALTLVREAGRSSQTLYTIKLVDPKTLAAAGEILLAATDGKTFRNRSAPANTYALRLDADRWYAAGAQGALSTSTNRGQSWSQVKLPVETYLFAIHQDTHGTWWLAGSEGTLLRASSPLKGWEQVKLPLKGKLLRFLEARGALYVFGAGGGARFDGKKWQALAGFSLLDVVTCGLETASGLVVFGDDGLIARSTDGLTFTKVKSPVEEAIEDVAVVSQAIFAVGGNNRGFVLRSTNEGKTFEVAHENFARKLWSITSWGSGAMVCGERGVIARLAAPKDAFFKGCVDEFAPPPPALPQGFVIPAATPAQAREAAHQKLLAAALIDVKQRAAKVKAAPPKDANRELAAAVDAREENAEHVYADWLESQGDVRGQLAAIQLKLESSPKDKALKASEAKLLKEHRETLLGGLHGLLKEHRETLLGGLHGFSDMLKLTWRCGFIDSARLANTQDRDDGDGGEEGESLTVPALLERLLAHPSARFLRSLTVGIVTFEDNSYGQVISTLGKHHLPALRELFLGDFSSDETELSWSSLGPVSALCGVAPNLEKLTLRSGNLSIGKVAFPRLKELIVESGGFSDMKAVCDATWPSLEKLSLQFGQESYGAETEAKCLTPLLDAAKLPRLSHLGITNSEFATDTIKLLAGSKLLAQLTSLDYSMSTLGDEGAHLLASYAPAFKHLSSLCLEQNYLTPDGLKLVKNLCAKVEVGKQRDDDGPDNRYAAVGE